MNAFEHDREEIERAAFLAEMIATPAVEDPRDTLVRELAEALQDSIESRMGRELRACDLPREWHRAQAFLKGR